MTELVLAALVALALGALIGWLIASRNTAAARAERDAEADKSRAAETELAIVRERAAELPPLRLMVDGLRQERDDLDRELAALRAGSEEREAALKASQERLISDREALAAQFSEIGGKLLGEAQKAFLDRAEARFKQSEETAGQGLKALLQPVEMTLKRYETNLAEVEKERVGSYRELQKAVTDLTQGNEVVRRETARLTNVLRSSPKARGRWGEEQLKTILEAAGLSENVDFTLQSSVSDGEKQLRPDCVITLPNGRCIVVDVKCPLIAFEQAFDEEDEVERARLLLAHAGAMKSYANDLGRKGYWRQFDLSPEFVIMFIPGEHFLSAAAERAPDLIETAFKNGVIVASTINMLALAKVMAGMWRQEALAQRAEEIGEVGKELYRRLWTMGAHVSRLGKNLNQATGAYNDFVGSLESQVMTQAKRFETLKIDTGGKSIEPLPVAEGATRALTKLSVVESGAEAAE